MTRDTVVRGISIWERAAGICASYSPRSFSHNHFVELEKEVTIPLAPLIKKVLLGK